MYITTVNLFKDQIPEKSACLDSTTCMHACVLCLFTQHEMHSVLDQVLEALGGRGRGGGPLGEEAGSLGGVGWGLLGLLSGTEVGAPQPEGHGMQHGRPGAAVVEARRVDGLWCIEGSACSQTTR